MQIEGKCKLLEADPSPVAALVRSHNRQIVRLFTVAECLQRESLAALNTLGPARGPRGTPRIGPGSKPLRSRLADELLSLLRRPLRGTRLRPVEALDDWLKAAGITSGRIFALTGQSVALIVKRHAEPAGLDPALFAGHSLRAGLVTTALEAGADVFKVMEITRHKRVETLKIYDRRSKFKNHAGRKFL